MEIRRAKPDELNSILKIYEAARRYMAKSGNPNQWGTKNPPKELIEEDIERGRCHVGVFEDFRVHCVFALIEGVDPTYLKIDGNWLNDLPYSTIHRLASDGAYHGIFRECIAYCKKNAENLRIDTHRDNATMHHLLQQHGFERYGTIYLKNGEPRVAYQYVKEC